jgi:hypothetical protein
MARATTSTEESDVARLDLFAHINMHLTLYKNYAHMTEVSVQGSSMAFLQ